MVRKPLGVVALCLAPLAARAQTAADAAVLVYQMSLGASPSQLVAIP